MIDDGLGDWRIAHATTLAKDIPSAFPGGPSHKAGAPVYLSTLAKHKEYGCLGFVTPSATALALNVAVKASEEAMRLRATLALQDVVTPFGKGKSVVDENLPHLYDFFQHCMITVAFSFQALEAFTNSVISRDPDRNIQVKRKNEVIEMKPEEAERKLSTSEKLSQVLPQLLEVPTPKGKKPWEGFVKLKRVRDSTIHLKSVDMYTRTEIDRESLYYQFLNYDPRQFPLFAFDMIAYYFESQREPRWARMFRRIVGK